jgi:hypothetical protein
MNRTAPFADQRDADAWASRPIGERASAAPPANASMRSAVNAILEVADRAGVPITFAVYGSHAAPTSPALIHVQGGPSMRQMPLSDALALFAAAHGSMSERMTRREPSETCPHTAIEFRLPGHHTKITVICEPTWEQASNG